MDYLHLHIFADNPIYLMKSELSPAGWRGFLLLD
jgi:hypothetical protein